MEHPSQHTFFQKNHPALSTDLSGWDFLRTRNWNFLYTEDVRSRCRCLRALCSFPQCQKGQIYLASSQSTQIELNNLHALAKEGHLRSYRHQYQQISQIAHNQNLFPLTTLPQHQDFTAAVLPFLETSALWGSDEKVSGLTQHKDLGEVVDGRDAKF